MKMNKVNKKHIAYYLLIAFVTIGLNACLDDEGVFKDDGSNGIVELTLPARTTSTPYSVKTTTLVVKDIIEVPVEVNYTGINGAPEDVQITLSIDNSIVDAFVQYNKDNNSADSIIVALPESNYQLPASNVVTIPKGQKKASFVIKFTPKTFDLTQYYALGIKIASATVGTISRNYSEGIYALPVQSPWEGKYRVTYRWETFNYLADNTEEVEEDIVLKTVGPGIIEAKNVANAYTGYTRFTFYPNGSVGTYIYSGSNLASGVIESSTDLENQTFHVKYWFSNNTRFILEEIYVRTGDLDE